MALLRRIWHRFFKKTTCVADEVFTPNEPATYTYVERKGVDEPLARALATTGKQIVVYGHSGSGKTTLLRHQLGAKYTRIVTTWCTSHMTLSDCVIDAIDQLEIFTKLRRQRPPLCSRWTRSAPI